MSDIPATAKKPQDHKKSAVQLEVEGVKTVEIKWQGLRLSFIADTDEWDGRISEAVENNQAVNAMLLIFGPDQMAKVWAKKPKKKDLRELYTVLMQAANASTPGE